MPAISLHQFGLEQVRSNWGWYLALGILLIIFGAIAIGRACLMTVASMVFFGWLLIFAGVMEVVHAFWKERGWGGFFIDLLTGILYAVVGFMILTNPLATAQTLTLLIAMFLIFGGIFRIVAAIAVRYPHWGWVALHGCVNLLLGILIWKQWPVSGLWVIGLFIGIEMLLNGWTLVMLGLTARSLPAEATKSPALS